MNDSSGMIMPTADMLLSLVDSASFILKLQDELNTSNAKTYFHAAR
jgi:hypothetical protein